MSKIILTILLCLVLTGSVLSQYSSNIIPYIKIGNLIASPSANDLGYVGAAGLNVEQFLDINKLNYGIGMQALFYYERNIRVGLDIGLQTLFSSKYDPNIGGGIFNYSYHNDNEQDIYFLAIAEYDLPGTNIFFQAGPGLHVVLWQWEYHYSSNYSGTDEQEMGSTLAPGLSFVAGITVPVARLKFPIFLRADQIFRYGSTITASLGVGVIL